MERRVFLLYVSVIGGGLLGVAVIYYLLQYQRLQSAFNL